MPPVDDATREAVTPHRGPAISGPAVRDALAVAGAVATSLIGLAGAIAGALAISGASWSLTAPDLFPMIGLDLALSPLGGWFMLISGAVAVIVGIYSVGYRRGGHFGAFSQAVMPVFVAAMLLVPMAASVPTFLFAWELMAGTSVLLVLTGHRRAEVRSAGVYYAILTHLGFAAILVALLVLAHAAGTTRFAAMPTVAGEISPLVRGGVFVLTLIGFGSKAGLLPLHAWLPRAHAESPSPVSALMSAAMVTMGCYGVAYIDLDILGPGPRWWGLAIIAVGAASALFGVLHASVATDLKRLLAFSTTENMGLVLVAFGAAALLASSGHPATAALALTAGLLHLLVHAAFKSLAFLAAGSVQVATGLRDLDRLGGLARPMPVTATLFGIAALGAAGLPVGAGFVSEWLLLQSLIHHPEQHDRLIAVVMPLTLGVVALSIGVGVATMVKAFGVGFLARPRSQAAADAREPSAAMRGAMVIAAVGCVVLAVVPSVAGPALRAVGAAMTIGTVRIDGAFLHAAGGLSSMAPGLLAVGLIGGVLLAVALSRIGAGRRPAELDAAPLWACGADELTSRMEYTATSFAQPLQHVFHGVLRPESDLTVTHASGAPYVIERMVFRERPTDAIEARLYTPVVRLVRALAGLVRRAHRGSVQLYVAYGGLGLVIVLVVSR